MESFPITAAVSGALRSPHILPVFSGTDIRALALSLGKGGPPGSSLSSQGSAWKERFPRKWFYQQKGKEASVSLSPFPVARGGLYAFRKEPHKPTQ